MTVEDDAGDERRGNPVWRLHAKYGREDLRYGTFDATDGEVEAATRAARAHEFVVDLPEGYDTEAGDRDVSLSSGQREHIALARAFPKDPERLVLDEATSCVEAEDGQEGGW